MLIKISLMYRYCIARLDVVILQDILNSIPLQSEFICMMDSLLTCTWSSISKGVISCMNRKKSSTNTHHHHVTYQQKEIE